MHKPIYREQYPSIWPGTDERRTSRTDWCGLLELLHQTAGDLTLVTCAEHASFKESNAALVLHYSPLNIGRDGFRYRASYIVCTLTSSFD